MIAYCPLEKTLSIISSKWKILIIRDLQVGERRFSELRRSLTGISQKMLTQSLKEMEKDGLIKRTVFAEVPPRVMYSLTKKGESLKAILESMADWGENYQKYVV